MTTTRLTLAVPTDHDTDALFEICSDPAVWTHYPSLRHSDRSVTHGMVANWILQWHRDELGVWVMRMRGSSAVIGYGGCSLRRDVFWNLGYRLAPNHQGRGFATEISGAAVEHANRVRPEVPVVAYLLENNAASARVAEKIGLTLVDRLPDAGNPDPRAIRLVYADRPLTDVERSAVADS